jgi:hypothetical protein
MDKRYTLAGEDSFREMVRYQEERRRHSGVGSQWSGTTGGSHPSNVVSMQGYRQQRVVTKRPPYSVPLKPSK